MPLFSGMIFCPKYCRNSETKSNHDRAATAAYCKPPMRRGGDATAEYPIMSMYLWIYIYRGGRYTEEDAKKIVVVHRDTENLAFHVLYLSIYLELNIVSTMAEGRDFVKRVLHRDHRKRTAARPLCHPWLRELNITDSQYL
ncbi:uncharacterized protein LOC125207719 [Salvia hispanica]|uniref:uncharacterized protein LOC125207719 n=1 Tax=Salvia hispanica TaxID=49212 RepID=UPI002009446F|nr:uncharacterized protein LOC125207719 [Salvia hispanica]